MFTLILPKKEQTAALNVCKSFNKSLFLQLSSQLRQATAKIQQLEVRNGAKAEAAELRGILLFFRHTQKEKKKRK